MATGKSSFKTSETLFIEWDQTRLLIIQGSSKSGQTTLSEAFAVERNPDLLPGELGDVLKDEFQTRNIKASSAVVVFPRELVTFTRVTVPNLPVAELPDLVKMQAATKLTVPVDSVCLDFTPLPVVDGMQTRDALLVTAPLDKVNAAKTALAVCGLEVASLQVSSFAIAEAAFSNKLLNPSKGTSGMDVVLCLSSDQIEMLYLSNSLLAFSHSGASWDSDDKIEQAVRSEVSRAQMAATAATGGSPVANVTLIGTPDITSKVPDDISKRLNGASVNRVDPSGLFHGDLPDSVTATDLFALAGAMAQAGKSNFETVDLLNPRKPIEKPDHTRLKRILAVGLGTLAIGAGWKWRADTVNGIDADTEELKTEVEQLNRTYKESDNLRELNADLEAWDARDINWLDEMERLNGLIGGTDRVLLKEFSFRANKGNYIASIDAKGTAKDDRDIEDLMAVMVEDGYEVEPTTITQSLSGTDYPYELDIEANVPTDRDSKSSKSDSAKTTKKKT